MYCCGFCAPALAFWSVVVVDPSALVAQVSRHCSGGFVVGTGCCCCCCCGSCSSEGLGHVFLLLLRTSPVKGWCRCCGGLAVLDVVFCFRCEKAGTGQLCVVSLFSTKRRIIVRSSSKVAPKKLVEQCLVASPPQTYASRKLGMAFGTVRGAVGAGGERKWEL